MKYVIKVKVCSKNKPEDCWHESWDFCPDRVPSLTEITEFAEAIMSNFNFEMPEESQRSLVCIESVGITEGSELRLADGSTPVVTVVKEEDTEVKLQRSVSELVELREFLEESSSDEAIAVSKTLDWLLDPEQSVDIEDLKDLV